MAPLTPLFWFAVLLGVLAGTYLVLDSLGTGRRRPLVRRLAWCAWCAAAFYSPLAAMLQLGLLAAAGGWLRRSQPVR